MIYKRLGIIAALVALLAFPVSASMVSFLLVETGISENNPNSQYSTAWEGGLMDAFFHDGHVVTNSPITRMEKRPDQDLSGTIGIDFNDAAINGADYFVLVYLEHQLQGNRVVPVGVTLRLYNTDSRQLVFERGFPAGTGRNMNDEYRLAQDAGRVITSQIRGR